jgi:acyl-CoA dehydrogenase
MLNAHRSAADVITMMFVDGDNLRFDNTDECASVALSRKTVATEAMIQTVRLALEGTGGFGYTRGSDIERLYRDVHGCLFHPLARATQTRITGRVAHGLPPLG